LEGLTNGLHRNRATAPQSQHDPKNKVTGECPVSGEPCTDVTGEHHSFICRGDDLSTAESVRDTYKGIYHVTRVEKVKAP